MLATSNNDRYMGIPAALDPGVTTWSAVHLIHRVPYVLITWASKEGSSWLSQSVIVWRPEDVLNCCQDLKTDKSRKILNLAVLIPDNMKKTCDWRWVPIKELWGTQLNKGVLAYPVYVAFDGERIGGFGELGTNETLRSAKRVYVSNKRPTPP